jgi:DNA integrity scanning protein DisA with diadenylate cyclase activity
MQRRADEKIVENKIQEELAEIGTRQQGIGEELGELIGKLDRHQKELLDDLVRLDQSLHGPEELLDRGDYSRPIPPREQHPKKANMKGN